MAMMERWSKEVRDNGSEPQRRFVLSYRPVIAQIAFQVASGLPPAVDLNDLISDGTIGLLKAIDSFDPSRQVQFSSYAEGRIRGAILDGLRNLDWMPRSLRRSLRALERARLQVQQRRGRPADSEELAREMDMTLDQFYALLSASAPSSPHPAQASAAVHFPPSPDELPDPAGPDPQADCMKREIGGLLQEALARMPAKEATVLSLYYFGDMNLKAIGARLGLSESRICQIHGRALGRAGKIMKQLISYPRNSRPRQDFRRLQEVS